MVKKKKGKEKSSKKEDRGSKSKKSNEVNKNSKTITMNLVSEREIAMDFATKAYQRFGQMIKSIVLFGSSAKKASTPDSDIDIVIIVDDVSINWDPELVAYYREELGKVIKNNPYKKSLHINTVKLSTWWEDLKRGDPIVVNVLRYGDALIDHGGFFDPLKILLKKGKIESTPESIYTLLQRAPTHLVRTRQALIGSVEGLYWACVDSAHAALIAAKVLPPSPEHIGDILEREFVKKKKLKKKYVDFYNSMHNLAKDIVHGKQVVIKGKTVDDLYDKSDEFLGVMAKLVDDLIDQKY